VGLVAELIPGSGLPSTWMDNADDVKQQPSDAADASRPDLWQYEGQWWRSSGISPTSAAGIDITTSYSPDWGFLGGAFSDIGSDHLSGGTNPGMVWNASAGRFIVRYYIDAAVKAEASYMLPFSFYSANSRHTLTAGAVGQQCGFYDWDGIDAYMDTLDGVDSDPIPWASIIDKWVEFDYVWTHATAGNSDGTLTVSIRTADDEDMSVNVNDLGVVMTDNATSDWGAYWSGDTVYGMSVTLGLAGQPGGCAYAALYDSPTIVTSPDLPLDDSVPNQCCDTHTPGVAAPGAGVHEIGRGWVPREDGGGGVEAEADPPPGEDLVDS